VEVGRRNNPARLTTREAGERLAVNPEKILGWIKSGELPAINVAQKAGGRPRYRIDSADLAVFEERRRVRVGKTTAQRRRRHQQSGIIEFF
jgi:excisionase family DNA binding protein